MRYQRSLAAPTTVWVRQAYGSASSTSGVSMSLSWFGARIAGCGAWMRSSAPMIVGIVNTRVAGNSSVCWAISRTSAGRFSRSHGSSSAVRLGPRILAAR